MAATQIWRPPLVFLLSINSLVPVALTTLLVCPYVCGYLIGPWCVALCSLLSILRCDVALCMHMIELPCGELQDATVSCN